MYVVQRWRHAYTGGEGREGRQTPVSTATAPVPVEGSNLPRLGEPERKRAASRKEISACAYMHDDDILT